MSIPATTGQLKNSIYDMSEGDYIKLSYDGTNFIFNSGIAELPVIAASSWALNQYLYMIKVDKGLLIADRNGQANISWLALDGVGRVQGQTYETKNAVPLMTSNTAPSGVASASAEWQNFNAYKVFDRTFGTNNPRWVSGPATSAWLQYDFGQSNEKVIRRYTIIASVYQSASPVSWTMEGSNTGMFNGEQVILDRQTAQKSWANKKEYNFYNNKPYRYYRINITESSGFPDYFTYIDELELIESVGQMRMPTGGSSPIDASGKQSFTDQKLGCWPSNNEWDKYIKNFPTSKIASGFKLDDVFHLNDSYSWVQDTVISGPYRDAYNNTDTGSSGLRTVRGYANRGRWEDFSFYAAGTSGSSIGYRPVFQFREV